MRLPLLCLASLGCCGQRMPELGWLVDRAGELRPIEGVSGAPQPGRAVARGVLAFARAPVWLGWTTSSEFCLRQDGGEISCRPLERDFAVLRFSSGGFPLRAYAPATAQFFDLDAADGAWRGCGTCPAVEADLIDFRVEAGGATRVLTAGDGGLRIRAYGAAGELRAEELLPGLRAPALLTPGGWVATAEEGLAGPDGWRWPGLRPGVLWSAAPGLLIAWDEDGPALLVPERRVLSRIAAEGRP